MTESEHKKLRGHFHALVGHERTLTQIPSFGPSDVADEGIYRMIEAEVQQVEASFPGILPIFEYQNFFMHDLGRGAYFRLHALRLYVSAAIGHLKAALEDAQNTPVTQNRDFTYVKEVGVRDIVARDYQEVQRAYVAKCWKSVIILCGGSIEAVLLDLLMQNESSARTARSTPKQPDLARWDLGDLINVAVELKFVSPGIEKLSHSVREYRNIVHPGNEIRKGLSFGEEEARIALEVLHILDRDLKKP